MQAPLNVRVHSAIGCELIRSNIEIPVAAQLLTSRLHVSIPM